MALDYNLLKLSPPEPTVKIMTAQEFLSGSQAVRDARRKRAIEESVRSGIDAKGDLDTVAMRQSLIAQGFGEDADRVVREVSMARLGDASTTAKIGYELSNMAAAGIIDPRIAENLFRTQIIETETEPPQTQAQTFAGVPGARLPGEEGYVSPTQSSKPDVDADGNIIIRATGDSSTQLSQMTPPQEPRQFTAKERGAQAVPDYLKNIVRFGGGQLGSAGYGIETPTSRMSWNVPTDGELKKYALQTANALGYDMTSAAAPLQEQMRARAEAAVPQVAPFYPPMDPKDLAKARMEWEQKKLDRAAKVEELFSKQAEAIEAGIRNYAGEKRAQAGERRAESGERRAERAQRVSLNPLDPTTNPELTREVTAEEYAKALQGSAGLRDMETAYKRYLNNPSLANLVAFQIGKKKASGEPITQDAIASGILESGAVPKEQELLLKGAIQSTNVRDLILGKGLDMTGISFNPQAASKEYFEEQLLNQAGDIQDRGRKVTAKDWLGAKKDNKPSTTSPQTSPEKPSRRKASKEDF